MNVCYHSLLVLTCIISTSCIPSLFADAFSADDQDVTRSSLHQLFYASAQGYYPTLTDIQNEPIPADLSINPGTGAIYYPKLLIVILVRNKASCLPVFFGHLEDLDYPKDAIELYIRTDHNQDNSPEVLEEWIETASEYYAHIDYRHSPNSDVPYAGEAGPFDWTAERHAHVAKLREDGLNHARQKGFQHVWFLDADVFITDNRAVQHLISERKWIVAPMLISHGSNYSNYWAGISEDGFYIRTSSYIPILYRDHEGVFKVPLIHSSVFVHLSHPHSDQLTFIERGQDISRSFQEAKDLRDFWKTTGRYTATGKEDEGEVAKHSGGQRRNRWFPSEGSEAAVRRACWKRSLGAQRCFPTHWKRSIVKSIPKCKSNKFQDHRSISIIPTLAKVGEKHEKTKDPVYSGAGKDDIFVFAHSAWALGIPLYVTNRHYFGYFLQPPPAENVLAVQTENMRHLALERLRDGPPGLLHSPTLHKYFYPTKHTYGFDKVYFINLERRNDRRERMEMCFDILGINATYWPASDGKELNEETIDGMGIRMLPGYEDPWGKRPLTMGEIGCFLSHYRIWKDVVELGLKDVLVFEDDLRFVKFFPQYLTAVRQDILDSALDWDLYYLGRKRLKAEEERDLEHVPGNPYLSPVSYSYWTLAYALSYQGAKKLLNADPLSKLVPVDEYLPIMFDQHPTAEWSHHFPNRNLKAFTTEPLLIYPTHYTGEPGHFSDTEASKIIPDPAIPSHEKEEL